MEKNSAKFCCDFCIAEFTAKRNLTRHHQIFHHGQRVLNVCDTCGKGFSRPDTLQRHMKTHQDLNEVKPDQEEQRLTCSQCKLQFLDQKQLDEHMEMHRLKKTYLCHTCGQIYHQSTKFMKHINSHRRPISPKSKKRIADQPTHHVKRRRQQQDLSPIVDLPSYINPDSCAAQVYNEHWLDIRDRQTFGRGHRFYNFHLPNLNNYIFKEKAEQVFKKQSTVFKINVSYGFVLRKNETNECRYFYASRNAKLFNEPALITDRSSFHEFLDEFLKEDVLEYALSLRPNSKWVVQHITNVTFYVFCIADHPIGKGIDLPAYVKENQSIVSLVNSRKDGKRYDDNLCFFRCLALFQGENPRRLETKAKTLLKQYKPNVSISKFPGIKLSELKQIEELFKINIIVYKLQPVDCSVGKNPIEEKEELADNENVIVAAKFVRRGMGKFLDTMYINVYETIDETHFSYISDIERYCQNYQCRTCDKLWKTQKSLHRHEKQCTSTATKHIFPDERATFHNSLTIWEELADEGIFIEENRKYFPYFATFYVESYLKEIENSRNLNDTPTDKLLFTSIHIPMSVSVSSNVPEYIDPFCQVSDGYSQKLIDNIIAYLLKISNHSYSLLESSYVDVFKMLDEKIQEFERVEKEKREAPHKATYLKSLKKRFTNHISKLPVVAFKSGRYDINAIKQYLYPSLLQRDYIESVITENHNHMALKSKHLQFLDISNFLAPGFSYAAFLKAYACEQGEGNFPHVSLDYLDKLNEPGLPSIEAFSDNLNHTTCSIEQYKYCQRIWKEQNMTCLRDYLIWYNKLHGTPFIEAVEKMRKFYKKLRIDLFKDGISVPGLTMKYLMKCSPNAHFSVISKKDEDLYHTFRDNLVGGPSIIFHRYHESGETKIRGSKPCKKIIGFEANALYLHAIMQQMPTGHYVRRRVENNFRPENRHPIAQEWLEYQSYCRKIPIRHAGNNSEKKIGLRTYVDGFCAKTKQVFEFHGCYFHGHSCHLTKGMTLNTKSGKTMKELSDKTQEKQRYIEGLGYEYISIRECVYYDMRKKDPKLRAFLTHNFPAPKCPGLTLDNLISAIHKGTLFGFVQCDIHVPHDLKVDFSEMCPIFKNVDISREDIGDVMRSYSVEHDIMKTPRRSLIGSMFGKNILLYTPLLQWYLSHGLVVTKIYQLVEYKPIACFTDFGQSVSEAQPMGDVDSSKSIVADTMKLIGNSFYGKTITNTEKHQHVKICNEEKAQKHVNNTLFRDFNPISENYYEVEIATKREIKKDLPVQIGHAVHHLAILRMLQFYYDFLLKYIDLSDFQMCKMDTDSAYIAISSDSFEEIIKPCMKHQYELDKANWFPRNDTPDNARNDKRIPGLFKVEWEGDGIVALCSQTYSCFGATDKFSCKGVNKKQNDITKDVYLQTIRSQVDGRGEKYSQIKNAFTYFYPNRKVLEDNVSTTFLDI